MFNFVDILIMFFHVTRGNLDLLLNNGLYLIYLNKWSLEDGMRVVLEPRRNKNSLIWKMA